MSVLSCAAHHMGPWSARAEPGSIAAPRITQAREGEIEMEELRPADSAEALALFRAQVLGPLLCREPGSHGELSAVLREIAAQPVLPPGAEVSRTYAASTLERWYYAFKKDGLQGLRSRSRGQGHAL